MIRIEQDGLGTLEVPAYAYYGIQTLRAAADNIQAANTPVHDEFIVAMACLKSAAAQANLILGTVPARIGNLIVKAAEEIMRGKHLEHFIADYIQGGTTDLLNTNMNEVLTNRALELMLEDKGNYDVINPNGHVNLAQSTNGVTSTALQIATHQLSRTLIQSIDQLRSGLLAKKEQIEEPYIQGSSNLKPGSQIWFCRQFGEAAQNLQRDRVRLDKAASRLQTIQLGSAAIGSDSNVHSEFTERTVSYLRGITQIDLLLSGSGEPLYSSDVFVELSSALKTLAITLSKLCSDIRLGATIEQSDLNLIGRAELGMAEALHQIAFQVIGFNYSVSLAAEAGMPDRNAVPPLIAYNLMESLKILIKGIDSFTLMVLEDDLKRTAHQ